MEQDVRGSQGRREEGRAHRQPARLVTYPNSFPSPRSPVSISSPHTDAGTEARISVTAQGLWFVLMLDQGWGGGGAAWSSLPQLPSAPSPPPPLPPPKPLRVPSAEANSNLGAGLRSLCPLQSGALRHIFSFDHSELRICPHCSTSSGNSASEDG